MAERTTRSDATDESGSAADPQLVRALVEASEGRRGLPGTITAIVSVDDVETVIEIVDGAVVGTGSADEAGVTVPLTGDQLADVMSGRESLAQAFMRGDVKPVGATGALLPVVELFEDGDFRAKLASLA